MVPHIALPFDRGITKKCAEQKALGDISTGSLLSLSFFELGSLT